MVVWRLRHLGGSLPTAGETRGKKGLGFIRNTRYIVVKNILFDFGTNFIARDNDIDVD